MNNALELRGKRFGQASKKGGGRGDSNMKGTEIVSSVHLSKLQEKLIQIQKFWEQETRPFKGILLSVYYNKVVAKSNRISGVLKKNKSNDAVVGAKFSNHKTKPKHIITYFLNNQDLERSIQLLKESKVYLDRYFDGKIDKQTFEDKGRFNRLSFKHSILSKSSFRQVIADVSYIDDFEVDRNIQEKKQSIVTLYDTNLDTKELLKQLGIQVLSSRILDNQTVFLDEQQLEVLFEKAPYLVSMAVEDLAELTPAEFIKKSQEELMFIPTPTVEPTIGVIDTLFDAGVYFNDWVEYHELVDKNLPRSQADYKHGTAVTSIIVDGPRLNPWLEDNCGRFKVRHFGVAGGGKFSSFSITKQIKEIIINNRDIKVWNLSLGSNQEINDNFISAEAAVLDELQFENDIIFVVAGTNKPNSEVEKIGSPADSINSLVVNSVTKEGLTTNYTRKGIALSFFAKPDISYYGGSKEEYIKVCEPLGEAFVAGTSFAAPWIARKISYLIDILGLNRELAKAMIIDAARDWNERPTPEEISIFGHGIVPIDIKEIVKTKEDEIKFLVSDISEKWNTFNYDFPVPLKNEKYPYIARATMCYFPMCNRTQGVDYTNTELNVKFGRLKENGELNDIKGDRQNMETELDSQECFIYEEDARKNFRKWDNVKYVSEKMKSKKVPKQILYETYKNWGIEVKTNNRLKSEDGQGIRFGIVITLKEMDGINRIDEIYHKLLLKWLVS